MSEANIAEDSGAIVNSCRVGPAGPCTALCAIVMDVMVDVDVQAFGTAVFGLLTPDTDGPWFDGPVEDGKFESGTMFIWSCALLVPALFALLISTGSASSWLDIVIRGGHSKNSLHVPIGYVEKRLCGVSKSYSTSVP